MRTALWHSRRMLRGGRHALLAAASRVCCTQESPVTDVRICLARTAMPTSMKQPCLQLCFHSSSSCHMTENHIPDAGEYESEVEVDEGWEEDETEGVVPQIGDGGDGGGIVLRDDVPWGQRALAIAQTILLSGSNDILLFAFKTSPRGYIYVRLDKLSNKYGCPNMDEIENFSHIYKTQLDEAGERGEIPNDLALEVSSPSAERLLKVPDDLERFKELPMRVHYNGENSEPAEGIFLLDSVATEHCMWKLADVKENKTQNKGRPFSRKQKDWRLQLPIQHINRVTLYLEY